MIPQSLAYVKWSLAAGEGSRDSVKYVELGTRAEAWLDTIDDLDQLDDLSLESRMGQGGTLKDMHWRDELPDFEETLRAEVEALGGVME